MRKVVVGGVIAVALVFGAAGASAEMAASGSMASHSAMASSAGHAKETKMDMMMVHNCHAMTHKKMLKDAECQDYMKHHPDWMKGK
ncbi:MAG TPA: hypothetical protein VIJ94_10450 [Caulobacteraceae bacterium]